jgi:hypothetical protein
MTPTFATRWDWPTYNRAAYPYFAPSKWKRRTMDRTGSQSWNGKGSALQASGWQGALHSHAVPVRCHPQRNAQLCAAGEPTTDGGISWAEETEAEPLGQSGEETEAKLTDTWIQGSQASTKKGSTNKKTSLFFWGRQKWTSRAQPTSQKTRRRNRHPANQVGRPP